MKTPLTSLLLIAMAAQNEALRCHTCVAGSEENCNQQGSITCPQYADACSTITGPNTVMKSCSYKSFCDKAHYGNPGFKMECCFTENCNGPHNAHSHGGHRSAAAAPGSCPTLLLGALLAFLATNRL